MIGRFPAGEMLMASDWYMLAALGFWLETLKTGSLQRNGRFRLVPHRPARRLAMLVLLLLVVASVAGLGYWYGITRSELDASYLKTLIRRDRANEVRIVELRSQLVDAEFARSVDQQAAESLRETITALRDEVAALREEAALYRNMLDPGSAEQGLRIAELELSVAPGSRRYHYHILLTRLDAAREVVSGSLEVQVQGVALMENSSRLRMLSLADLVDLDEYPIPFRFRYFQGLSGVMTLPPDFEPGSVLIRLLPAAGGDETVRREFDWQVDVQ